MCQSIATFYQFCGCPGASYQQKCSVSTSLCASLLARPTPLKLECYCPEHSARKFKTVRQDERDTKLFDQEYRKVLKRESQQARKREQEDEANERTKYEHFWDKDRRKVAAYKRGNSEKKAGLRPGIREKSDGICRVMKAA